MSAQPKLHWAAVAITTRRASIWAVLISRHDIDLKFNAEGGEALVDGLYMLNGSQHADTHSVIDHLVPNCTSSQNYKGVLNDKSRGRI